MRSNSGVRTGTTPLPELTTEIEKNHVVLDQPAEPGSSSDRKTKRTERKWPASECRRAPEKKAPTLKITPARERQEPSKRGRAREAADAGDARASKRAHSAEDGAVAAAAEWGGGINLKQPTLKSRRARREAETRGMDRADESTPRPVAGAEVSPTPSQQHSKENRDRNHGSAIIGFTTQWYHGSFTTSCYYDRVDQ